MLHAYCVLDSTLKNFPHAVLFKPSNPHPPSPEFNNIIARFLQMRKPLELASQLPMAKIQTHSYLTPKPLM